MSAPPKGEALLGVRQDLGSRHQETARKNPILARIASAVAFVSGSTDPLATSHGSDSFAERGVFGVRLFAPGASEARTSSIS